VLRSLRHGALEHVGRVGDFHPRVSAPCRAHIKKGPSIGAFQYTKVFSYWRSSRSGREQLPVLRQNYLIDCMNDAVRRDEIPLRDAGSINPHV
jgi:hypothetical protein